MKPWINKALLNKLVKYKAANWHDYNNGLRTGLQKKP